MTRYLRRKVTAEDVAEIRRLYRTQGWLQKQLATEFEVSQPQISRIINGHQWPTEEDQCPSGS